MQEPTTQFEESIDKKLINIRAAKREFDQAQKCLVRENNESIKELINNFLYLFISHKVITIYREIATLYAEHSSEKQSKWNNYANVIIQELNTYVSPIRNIITNIDNLAIETNKQESFRHLIKQLITDEIMSSLDTPCELKELLKIEKALLEYLSSTSVEQNSAIENACRL